MASAILFCINSALAKTCSASDVAPIGFEDIGGDPLGIGRMSAIESNHGPLQRFIAAARTAMGDRMSQLARHRAPQAADRS